MKRERMPRDPNQLAKAVVDLATAPYEVSEEETDRTMLRLLHHAASEHMRVWHGHIPMRERAEEVTPIRVTISAIDLVAEHLGEDKISRSKTRTERKHDEYQRRQFRSSEPSA